MPRLATDRLCRSGIAAADEPLATVSSGARSLLVAVNPVAERQGLRGGMTLADAQMILPELRLADADPVADRALLERLAESCLRYTPWAAVDGEAETGGGLWLDVSGCAHLLGGEANLLDDLRAHLGRLGLTSRAALADTPGAAWAWARFGAAGCLGSSRLKEQLAGLPVMALRLPPPLAAGLIRLGLKRLGDLYALPRAALAHRFGSMLLRRLDQALGDVEEPISPCRPVTIPRTSLAFAEPIGRSSDLLAACRQMLDALCRRLEEQGLGLRRLELSAWRCDTSLGRLTIGTSRPCRDPRHLFGLLTEALTGFEAGPGIESLACAALECEVLTPLQADWERARPIGDGLAQLLDSLANRLGPDQVYALDWQASHLPERAVRRVAPGQATGQAPPVLGRRPLRLLRRPEPITAMAALPDGPPLLFCQGGKVHHLARAEGPERLAGEWWRGDDQPDRDYYRVEDEAGRRFWLFRSGVYQAGRRPRWFLHGRFV